MSNHNVYGQPPSPGVAPSSVISLVPGIPAVEEGWMRKLAGERIFS